MVVRTLCWAEAPSKRWAFWAATKSPHCALTAHPPLASGSASVLGRWRPRGHVEGVHASFTAIVHPHGCRRGRPFTAEERKRPGLWVPPPRASARVCVLPACAVVLCST